MQHDLNHRWWATRRRFFDCEAEYQTGKISKFHIFGGGWRWCCVRHLVRVWAELNYFDNSFLLPVVTVGITVNLLAETKNANQVLWDGEGDGDVIMPLQCPHYIAASQHVKHLHQIIFSLNFQIWRDLNHQNFLVSSGFRIWVRDANKTWRLLGCHLFMTYFYRPLSIAGKSLNPPQRYRKIQVLQTLRHNFL